MRSNYFLTISFSCFPDQLKSLVKRNDNDHYSYVWAFLQANLDHNVKQSGPWLKKYNITVSVISNMIYILNFRTLSYRPRSHWKTKKTLSFWSNLVWYKNSLIWPFLLSLSTQSCRPQSQEKIKTTNEK